MAVAKIRFMNNCFTVLYSGIYASVYAGPFKKVFNAIVFLVWTHLFGLGYRTGHTSKGVAPCRTDRPSLLFTAW